MAKTNAERQAKFRRLIQGGHVARINVVVPISTRKALDRLTAHYGLTVQDALTKIILAEQGRVIDALPDPEYRRFLGLSEIAAS